MSDRSSLMMSTCRCSHCPMASAGQLRINAADSRLVDGYAYGYSVVVGTSSVGLPSPLGFGPYWLGP